MTAPKMTAAASAPYEVGYGKPPRHTQFRKGQSGNPGGRPRRVPRERMKALALQEAYRSIAVKEDGRTIAVPAIQAILRSQMKLAAKGNVQAQRAVLAAVEAIERNNMEAARIAAERQPVKYSYNEAARRIMLLLRLAEKEKKQEEEKRQKQEAGKRDAGPPASAAARPRPEDDGPGQAVPPAAPPSPQPPSAPWREPPVDPRPSYARHPARSTIAVRSRNSRSR
jgi:hypothetical protein